MELSTVAQDHVDPAGHLVGIARAEVVALAHPHALQQLLHIRSSHAVVRELFWPDVAIEQCHRT